MAQAWLHCDSYRTYKPFSEEDEKLSTLANSNILHKTTNRLNSTGSDYSSFPLRGSSSAEEDLTSLKVEKFWNSKLDEIEVWIYLQTNVLFFDLQNYKGWDRQYILDTLLRDAVILERPKEVEKLISLDANINCNQFPQVTLIISQMPCNVIINNAKFDPQIGRKSIYSYAIETDSKEIIQILIKAGCNQQF